VHKLRGRTLLLSDRQPVEEYLHLLCDTGYGPDLLHNIGGLQRFLLLNETERPFERRELLGRVV